MLGCTCNLALVSAEYGVLGPLRILSYDSSTAVRRGSWWSWSVGRVHDYEGDKSTRFIHITRSCPLSMSDW